MGQEVGYRGRELRNDREEENVIKRCRETDRERELSIRLKEIKYIYPNRENISVREMKEKEKEGS